MQRPVGAKGRSEMKQSSPRSAQFHPNHAAWRHPVFRFAFVVGLGGCNGIVDRPGEALPSDRNQPDASASMPRLPDAFVPPNGLVGTVSDLSVESVGTDSVTLRFT